MANHPALDDLVSTRQSLHRVAEHVLAAALKRATGQIALRPLADGLGTPPLPDGAVLSLRGCDIAVERGDGVRRQRLTTVREAAELAGTEPGFPWSKHPPATAYEPDEPLTVDEAGATTLSEWFALGDQTLMRWAAEIPGDGPTEALIFPEHFDLAITAAETNYGFSPGDAAIALPYVYVGPFSGPPTQDEFWNAKFGAYRTIAEVPSVDAALAFFRSARARLQAG